MEKAKSEIKEQLISEIMSLTDAQAAEVLRIFQEQIEKPLR